MMSTPGGYRVPASDLKAIDDKFFCPSCGYILKLAVQTECGHLYCEECLADLKRQNNPVCIKCGTSLEQIQWYPDIFVRREIAGIDVSCFNIASGCTWNGCLKYSEEHQCSCPWRLVPCQNDGCTSELPACQLVFHEEQECCHRRTVCEHCSSPETMESLQDHLETCPDVPVSCANCGKENIPRSQLSRHSDPVNGDCTRNRCPFREHGCMCDELMNHEALTRHLTEGFHLHLFLLVSLLKGGSRQTGVPPPDGSVRQDLHSAEAEIVAHSWALSAHYRQLRELDGEVKTLIDALAEVVGGLDQLSATNTAQMQEISGLKNRVEQLETTVQRQDTTINILLQLIGAFLHLPQQSTLGAGSQNS